MMDIEILRFMEWYKPKMDAKEREGIIERYLGPRPSVDYKTNVKKDPPKEIKIPVIFEAESEFHCMNCGSHGADEFKYIYNSADAEIWDCKECGETISVEEQEENN